MYKTTILLNTVDKIKDFVKITTRYACEFDLVSGRYIVDGKSIMGIFALDSSRPLELRILSDDDRVLTNIREEISRFAA